MGKIKPQALLQQSKKKKGPARIGLSTIITCNLVIIVIVLSLYAAYRHWYRRNQFETDLHGSKDFETIGGARRSMKFELPTYAILNTSKGLVTLELYKEAAPEVVNRFLDLCQRGHFKGMQFHRVIKNYVIQVGGYEKPGAAEDWIVMRKSDGPLGIRYSSSFTNVPCIGPSCLQLRKVNHDGEDFLLIITTAPIFQLNDKFIVFGRVIKGDEVIKDIEDVDTDEHYQPKMPVEIDDINLKQDA